MRPRPRRRTIVLLCLAACLVVLVGLLVRYGASLRAVVGSSPDTGPGGQAALQLPPGLSATVFAQGLAGPRFMALTPSGTVLVAERGADRVVALPDANHDGAADAVVEVGRGYGSAHSIAFDRDGSLLVAGETTLWRVSLGPDLREATRAVVYDGLPTGGHNTRTILVRPDGQLLLSVGSSCNVCVEEDPRRAAVLLVDPATGTARVWARGLRNAVGLVTDPATGETWADVMGRDLLGDDSPPETVYRLSDGLDAGWPRCHAGRIVDPDFGATADPVSGRTGCDRVATPALELTAHSAPLAMAFWRDHLVIALHGSWNRTEKSGYAVLWVPWRDGAPAGSPEVLATGFLPSASGAADGRPAGLLVLPDGSLLVSDDKAGFIYRIAAGG